ncbi:GntR family transcriptional regulator [Oribacterium sp. C9]|uniref:GntR family transcriptional regulator n=1 Tax=Oribacterium sp. C9 TaxID=1943579 RepID=UPI00098F4032|nr:GntR family transcriptional regulator [Oribacterium sp. C9]OON84878.1 GntR family transcriptional regulator [Oribacterium sp. C9]
MESLELMPARIKITSILKKAIYSGEYKSGQELSLTGVAEQLGISRTPVREAFQTLASEGLITLRMNKGAVVNKIDEKFIKDNFEMRILLESEAAARAANNGMETEKLLTELYKMRDQRPDEIDVSEYIELNQSIHTNIWKASDNSKLTQYLYELWNGPSTGHSRPESIIHYQKSTMEHIDILEYIRDGKAKDARKAMSQHIGRSMENILKYYSEN